MPHYQGHYFCDNSDNVPLACHGVDSFPIFKITFYVSKLILKFKTGFKKW